MDIKSNIPIYLQIAEYVHSKILQDQWKETERVPSVRELAATLQVNPNTVMRAYELLDKDKIIYNQRGLGFFVAADAKSLILTSHKQKFLEEDLKDVLSKARMLHITEQELMQVWESILS